MRSYPIPYDEFHGDMQASVAGFASKASVVEGISGQAPLGDTTCDDDGRPTRIRTLNKAGGDFTGEK